MRTLFKLVVVATLAVLVAASPRYARADVGHPAGLLYDCPGVFKNASISPRMMKRLQIVIQRVSNGVVRRYSVPVASAHRSLEKDKHIDLKRRKTVLYAVGFLDSSVYPQTQAVANAYSKKGYNVFITETLDFLSLIYPKSVRMTRVIGNKLGQFLVQLKNMGLSPNNLELVGLSLGAHIVGYAAKYFYSATGEKVQRITGLDPAGPCFRSLPAKYRLDSSDANFVDIIHTNIDGFGIAETLGHVDFYANGGEFQPSDLPFIPCLVVCSHLRAVIYWWIALENPKKFISMRCNSVEDARYANCYEHPTDLNYLGLETNFTKSGIFYLPTNNEFPYYRGKDGLKAENEIYTSMIKNMNSDDVLVV